MGVVFGKNLDQIRSSVVKKSKETGITNRFFSYFEQGIHFKLPSKFCLKNSLFESWGQNVGPNCVKNGKKDCFHTSKHLTTNLVLPKNKFLRKHSLLTH